MSGMTKVRFIGRLHSRRDLRGPMPSHRVSSHRADQPAGGSAYSLSPFGGDPGSLDRTLSYARKNTNQIRPRINIASPVETASMASTDGPGSAWRASVGVSMI